MLSHSNYCIETWGSWEPRGNKVLLQRLQAVLNKFFRLIYHMDRDESVRQVLKSHNIFNIYQSYDFCVSQTIYKAINNDLPNPLQRVLTTSNPFFFFKVPRLKQTEKSISFSGPKLWNKLPLELITESNFGVFKRELKMHIMNQ